MKKYFQEQVIPITLTIATFFFFAGLLLFFLQFLNNFSGKEKISLVLRPIDVIVGLTIYVKTAIDFALFIAGLMARFPGSKNRILIEFGTATGNFIGTLLVLCVWTFFKEVPLLMICMIFLASLVLFRMSEDSLQEFLLQTDRYKVVLLFLRKAIFFLHALNQFFLPLTKLLLPPRTIKEKKRTGSLSLLLFAITIPFVLGLDDFAGYIPLFSIVNVFGFAVGVFLGHMLLNVFLFASPSHTTQLVKLPLVSLFGSIVFIGIGLFGFYEIGRIALSFMPH